MHAKEYIWPFDWVVARDSSLFRLFMMVALRLCRYLRDHMLISWRGTGKRLSTTRQSLACIKNVSPENSLHPYTQHGSGGPNRIETQKVCPPQTNDSPPKYAPNNLNGRACVCVCTSELICASINKRGRVSTAKMPENCTDAVFVVIAVAIISVLDRMHSRE